MARFTHLNPKLNNACVVNFVLARSGLLHDASQHIYLQDDPTVKAMQVNQVKLFEVSATKLLEAVQRVEELDIKVTRWEAPVLPFEFIWLGLDADVQITPNTYISGFIITPRDIRMVVKGMSIIHYGLTQYTFDFFPLANNEGIHEFQKQAHLAHANTVTYMVSAVTALLSTLNTASIRVYRKILSGSDSRNISNSTGVSRGKIPQAYYSIKVQDNVMWDNQIRQSAITQKSKSSPAYRHDVAGHYRFFVRTGPLSELDPVLIQDLIRRNYQISISPFYEFEDDTALYLNRNGIVRQEGEYLAVLKSRVTDYIKGPPDKPYVPGRRVVKNGTENKAPGIIVEYASKYSFGTPTILYYPAECYMEDKIDKPTYYMGDRRKVITPYVCASYQYAAQKALSQIQAADGWPTSIKTISVLGEIKDCSIERLEQLSRSQRQSEVHFKSASEAALTAAKK